MTYLHLQTQTYPLTKWEVMSRHPNTSFPIDDDLFNQCICDFGYACVEETPKPPTDHSQNAVEVFPTNQNGTYKRTWEIVPATEEEVLDRTLEKGREIRDKRSYLLKESDWTQLNDSSVDTQAWATYRQKLRDLTIQPGFPWDVTWPEPPPSSLPLRLSKI